MTSSASPAPKVIGTKQPNAAYTDRSAVIREMQEETGALITLRLDLGCIATTEEYRNDLHQMSYCYVADVVDDSGRPSLTHDEVQDGLGRIWLPIDEARKRMEEAQPTSELGRFIKERCVYLFGSGGQSAGETLD